MSVCQIQDQVRVRVIDLIQPIFDYFDITVTPQNIVFNHCTLGDKLDAEFYITSIRKIKKDIFDEVIDFVYDTRKDIMLKMTRNKAGKHVLFHLLYTNDPETLPIYPPLKQNPI